MAGGNVPEYIRKALSSFRPADKMTVSEWADRYRILSGKDSSLPGPWRTERTPYLRGVMDAFNTDGIQDITFCAGTQVGKTVAEQNMMGYAIAQEPGPMLVVYPSDKLAEFTSENRLRPMIRLSENLKTHFDERGSERLELRFDNMYIALVGANSPANLASRPVRYVFFDEIDKFPKWTGTEASPLELASERTKTFWNRKIVKVSTPTLATGNIWKSWLRADAQKKFFVPCPHCGAFQELEFRQIKWQEGMSQQDVLYGASYECTHCHQMIDDRYKPDMLRHGKWQKVNDGKGRIRSVGFHLNSLYSPWLTWGDIAVKFLSSKEVPEDLMNFVNSWLAEPWQSKANRMQSDIVMSKQQPHERGKVPEEARLLTMGVDVQLDHFWWGIRAWGTHQTSWLVDYGRAETWGDVEYMLERDWPTENGEPRQINLCCIDAGFRTEEVYFFCAQHQGQAIPTKGSSRMMTTRYNVNKIDRSGYGMLNLYVFDTGQFKDFISGRLSVAAGAPGSWNVFDGIDRRYCDMICSEQKVEHQDKKGRITFSWEKISSHAQNHMLDVETNNALAAEIMGVRYMRDEEEPRQARTRKMQEEDFIGSLGDEWFEDPDEMR